MKNKNGTAEFTNEVQHYYDKVLSLWKNNIDISRWKTVVRLPDFVKAGIQRYKLQRMDPRIREDDKTAVRGPTPG
jgi:hypothetical protein